MLFLTPDNPWTYCTCSHQQSNNDSMVDYCSFFTSSDRLQVIYYDARKKWMDNHVAFNPLIKIQHHPYVCPWGSAEFLKNAWQSTFYPNTPNLVDWKTHLSGINICHSNICHLSFHARCWCSFCFHWSSEVGPDQYCSRGWDNFGICDVIRLHLVSLWFLSQYCQESGITLSDRRWSC